MLQIAYINELHAMNQKNLEKYMHLPENWITYIEKEENEEPISIILNIGLSNLAPIAFYSKLLFISVNYIPKKNGFPIDSELDKFEIVDEDLPALLSKAFGAIHVGSFITEGSKNYCIYFKHEEQLDKILINSLHEFPNYDYNFSTDETWDMYWGVLMPTNEQYQSIQNKKVLDNMKEHGDSLLKPREVKHWAYFKSKKDRNVFEKDVKLKNFDIVEKSYDIENIFPYEIILSRTDSVAYNEIDNYTFQLYEIVHGLNGYYDGWECESFIDKQ